MKLNRKELYNLVENSVRKNLSSRFLTEGGQWIDEYDRNSFENLVRRAEQAFKVEKIDEFSFTLNGMDFTVKFNGNCFTFSSGQAVASGVGRSYDLRETLKHCWAMSNGVAENKVKGSNMKRNAVRLTEAQLHAVIKESVKRILSEGPFDRAYGASKARGEWRDAIDSTKAGRAIHGAVNKVFPHKHHDYDAITNRAEREFENGNVDPKTVANGYAQNFGARDTIDGEFED